MRRKQHEYRQQAIHIANAVGELFRGQTGGRASGPGGHAPQQQMPDSARAAALARAGIRLKGNGHG
jgi:hypothetical protein